MTEIITRNVEYQIEFIVKIDSPTVKDLTGFTPLIQIRPYIDSDTVYASYTIGSPYITFTPVSGLHTERNLQLLSTHNNSVKSNKFTDHDMDFIDYVDVIALCSVKCQSDFK